MPSRRRVAACALSGRRTLMVAALLSCAAGCGGKGAVTDPLKLVPADSRIVAQVNVARLRQTQLKDRLLQLRDRSESLKKKWDALVQKSGLDPLRDLDTVMFAMPYQGAEGGSDAGVILFGRFNQPQVVAWYKEHAGAKATETKYGNRSIYADADGTYHLGFVNSTTAVVGSAAWVKKVLDLADGKGQSARQSPPLVDLTNRARGNQVVWGVVQVPDEALRRAKEADSPFKAVPAMLFTLDFAAGLEVDFRAECTDDNEAKTLTDKFTNLVKELQDSPMFGSMGFGGILQHVKGAQEGKTFRARANLPQKELDELIKKVEEVFKAKLSDMPRIKLPSTAEGGPKLDDDQPAPDKAADDKGTEGHGDEPKAAPGDGSGGLPTLKLTPPGDGTKQKRRPGLLGQ